MRRTVPLLGALVALTVSAPAHATPCPLVTDAVGDPAPHGTPWPAAPPVALSRNVDIVSIDVASGPTTVVAVVRVADLALDPAAAGLPRWQARWRVAGVSYGVHAGATLTAAGPGWHSSFYREGGPYDVATPVVVDVANGTFTWTLPRSWFPELATPGATFDRFHGLAKDPVTTLADWAGVWHVTTVTWTDGTPGCVPAA